VFLFFNGVFLPFFVIGRFDFNLFDIKKTQFIAGWLFVFALIVSLFYFLNDPGALIGNGGRISANNTLDTISLGHMGVSVALFGLFYFSNTTSKRQKTIAVCLTLLGTFVCFAAGSRGPVVALLVTLFIYFFATKRISFLVLVALLICFVSMFYETINEFLASNFDVYSLERIYNSFFERSNDLSGLTSGRDRLYQAGIEDFLESPIIGSSFVLDSGMYVHNSILEAFMATGLIGGILFCIIVLFVFIYSVKIAKTDTKYMFIALLAVQYIIYSFFSRALMMLPELWLMLFLVNRLHETIKYTRK
jgi:oligosaccharide repeat unit polymerase